METNSVFHLKDGNNQKHLDPNPKDLYISVVEIMTMLMMVVMMFVMIIMIIAIIRTIITIISQSAICIVVP